jgi:hypothetical protein
MDALNSIQFKICRALELFFERMPSISLSLASAHTGTMAPQIANHQIAELPIQVLLKEHLSVNDIHSTSVD